MRPKRRLSAHSSASAPTLCENAPSNVGYAELADLWPDVHAAAETRERRHRYAHRADRVDA